MRRRGVRTTAERPLPDSRWCSSGALAPRLAPLLACQHRFVPPPERGPLLKRYLAQRIWKPGRFTGLAGADLGLQRQAAGSVAHDR
jgi:hypothetical protein